MNQPQWIIHPTIEELENVYRFVCTTQPDEIDDNGVWTYYDGMERVWTGSASDTVWEVRGGLSIEPQRRQHLPARAIRDAFRIADDEDAEAVTMLIPSGSELVIVQGATTETVIDLHKEAHPIRDRPDRPSGARATINAGRFSDLLARARITPVGGSSELLPDPVFTVIDGAISIHADWSIRNGRRTTYRSEATTTDQAQCLLPLGPISETVRGIDRDVDVEIDLPADPFEKIIIREPGAWSTYPYRPSDARRFNDDVVVVLIELVGEGFECVEYGSFRLDVDDREFTIQLLDAPDPVVRVATVVCDGFGGLFGVDELLEQLNATNAGIVGGRLWLDDGVVRAAIDLPAAALGSIAWAVQKLCTQLAGFDVFLGALVTVEGCE